MKINSQIFIQQFSIYRTNIIGFSLGLSEVHIVGVILGKVLICTLTENYGLPLGLSLGLILRIWEVFLFGITEGVG